MVSGTLYTFLDSFRGSKCRIAAAYSGSDLTVVEVSASDKTHSHVPNFVSTDKKVNLFDANAIAYYLADDQQRGNTAEERASVVQWVSYGSTEVASAVASWVYPALSLVEATPQNTQKAMGDMRKIFAFLNETLKTRTFLATERVTLADVSLATDLLLAYRHVLDEKFLKPYGNVTRWFTTVINQPNFKKVVGDIVFCVTPAQFSAEKFEEFKVQQKAKNEKPKAEKVKAEKPKPVKKEVVKSEAEEEDEEFVEPPKNDPFAVMEKGTFNMDEFKRVYSNEDTVTKAIPYFYEKFEKEYYSVWFCKYKYSAELNKVFMTSNLIGGMFQRIEKLRKNAFGSMCVWGEDNNNTIAGVWFWRGQELAFPLCNDWTTDYETYEWRKMNIDDEADKELIRSHLTWEGLFEGKKFADGKIFK